MGGVARPRIAACIASLFWLAAICWLAAPAAAQGYPTRAVTIVVPFGPGSATDTTARLIAQGLQEALGRPFVVENKSGGGGLIAANAVARAEPDGYTLLITTNSTHSAAPGLFKTVPYDPIKDFTAVARIGSFPSFLGVDPRLPIRSMAELVAYAKQNPGKLIYGHGNSTGQIVGEALKHRTGIDMVRVAYRSVPAGMTDLMGGHICVMIPDFGNGLPQLQAEKIRALAVLTAARNSRLPDVPTLNETVMPGFDLLAWVGLFGPAGMPEPVVARLAAETEKILKNPALKARFTAAGADTFWSDPQEFDAYVKSELTKWTSLIKEAGIEPE
jgi:tripartite-type tricarboxylate transporter receptor subunit TctC